MVFRNPTDSKNLLIYAHGSNDLLDYDGTFLRMAADHGFAAVSFEYSTQDSSEFQRELTALSEHLTNHSPVKTLSSVWIGLSLGFEKLVSCLNTEKAYYPEALVGISASIPGWKSKSKSDESENENEDQNNQTQVVNLSCPLLLIHGSRDTVIPVESVGQFAKQQLRKGRNTRILILAEHDHHLFPNKNVAFKTALEFVSSYAEHQPPVDIRSPNHWLSFSSLILCILPISLLILVFRYWIGECRPSRHLLIWIFIILSSFVYLLWLQQAHLNRLKIHIAANLSVPPDQKDTLITLAKTQRKPGRNLTPIIQHLRRTDWNQRVLNSQWEVDAVTHPFGKDTELPSNDKTFKSLTGFTTHQLWECLIARIKNTHNQKEAANEIARFLREIIHFKIPHQPAGKKLSGKTKNRLFDKLYLHSLGLVGISTRISQGKIQIKNGNNWILTPRPAIECFPEYQDSVK